MKRIQKYVFLMLVMVTLITLNNSFQKVTLNVHEKNSWILKVTDGYLLNIKAHKNKINKVKVGIIDSGFDYSNPNISLINIKKDVSEDVHNYHGTMIAALIGAKRNSIQDFSGILPGIDLYAYHLSDNELDTLSLSRAIREMADNDIDIINLSLSTTLNDENLYKSIIYALNKGIVFVCSSGNTANEQKLYPASYDIKGIISVGAIDKNMNVLPTTTFNNFVDVFAPGEDIYLPSNFHGSKITKYSGTSLATPIVTSLVIILKVRCTYLTPEQIEKIITDNADSYAATWKHYRKRISIISFRNTLNFIDNNCTPLNSKL